MNPGRSDVIIHDIASAAERAKVEPVVILRWIKEGLRATPVGRVGRRGPRDYRIFDSWLIEFLEARAAAEPADPGAEGTTGQASRRRRVRVPAGSAPAPEGNPLGPCPRSRPTG
jgi:hypothetical protein